MNLSEATVLLVDDEPDLLDIFDVQEQQPVGVFVNGFDRIAAALEIMRDVEFELRVARVGRRQDLIDFFRGLPKRTHVIVITQWDSNFRGLLPDRG